MHDQMKAKSRIFPLFLSYFCSLLLTMLIGVALVAVTLCSRTFFKTQVLKSNFCTIVLGELQENYESYGAAGGFSPEVMTGFLSEDQIQKDMFRAVDRFYDGERTTLQHPEIKDAAMSAFLADIKERKLTVTPQVQEGLEELASGCESDYENYVNVMMSTYFAPLLPKMVKLVRLALVFLCMATAASGALLLVAERRTAFRLRYVIYALTAVSLLSGAFGLSLKLFVPIGKINISPQSAYSLINSYISNLFAGFFCVSLLFLVLAVALGFALGNWNKRHAAQPEED